MTETPSRKTPVETAVRSLAVAMRLCTKGWKPVMTETESAAMAATTAAASRRAVTVAWIGARRAMMAT